MARNMVTQYWKVRRQGKDIFDRKDSSHVSLKKQNIALLSSV